MCSAESASIMEITPAGGYGGSMEHHHTETKIVIDRLSRTIGHLEKVREMVEEGRDCSDVLIQLSAVRASLAGIGRVIISDHLEHCIREAVESGDSKALDDFRAALEMFVK